MKRFPPFLFLLLVYACQSGPKSPDASLEDSTIKNDTTQIVHSFICGLWSLDSQNILNNEGYFFKSDGTVDFVASEYQGEWNLIGPDSIKVKYSYDNRSHEMGLHIDSLNESRMILSDSEGVHLFRKVPFGVNMEENVLSGFTGTITPKMTKEYLFSIPSAKKIRVSMNTNSDNVRFKIYYDKEELTSIPVKDWQSIMVRSGNYKIVVDYLDRKKMEAEEFTIRVFGQ